MKEVLITKTELNINKHNRAPIYTVPNKKRRI